MCHFDYCFSEDYIVHEIIQQITFTNICTNIRRDFYERFHWQLRKDLASLRSANSKNFQHEVDEVKWLWVTKAA